MNAETFSIESSQKPLRMWPAVVLMAIIVLCRYVPGFIEGASSQFWYVPVFFPLLASVLMLIWWLAGSRATGREKLLGFFGFLLAVAVIVLVSHPSMRGLITTYLAVPLGMIGFGLGAFFLRRQPSPQRARGALLGAVLAMSITLFFQSYGITGAYAFELHSRWSSAPGAGSWTKGAPSKPESAGAAIETAVAAAEWPGFRGADRLGHTEAPKLTTDWTANPPKLLWKKPVGAGWSSFAVAGPFAFTQEQRGPNEVVACYEVATGQEVWTQQREARFDEPMAAPVRAPPRRWPMARSSS